MVAFRSSSTKDSTQPVSTSIPTSQPVIFDPKKIDQNTQEFTITEVSPDLTQPITDRFIPLEITFNQTTEKSAIKFTLVPNNNIQTNFYNTKVGYSVLEIIPIDPWLDNTSYQLILDKSTQTKGGTLLGKDYVINFKVEAYTGI